MWTWHIARASLPRVPFRQLRWRGTPSQNEGFRLRVRRIVAQALGLLDVTWRVLHYANMRGQRTALWNSAEAQHPFYVDARPQTWLGPYSHEKYYILGQICRELWRRLSWGHNSWEGYIMFLKRGACNDHSACHLSLPEIRLNERLWEHDNAVPPALDAVVGEDAWSAAGTGGPCWAPRVMLHEALHWVKPPLMGHLIDVRVKGNEFQDDRGPCPGDVLDDDGDYHPCYHGGCAQGLIQQNPIWGIRNIDNYAYLMRNMGMHYSDLVRAHDAEFPRPDLPCTGANCISVDW